MVILYICLNIWKETAKKANWIKRHFETDINKNRILVDSKRLNIEEVRRKTETIPDIERTKILCPIWPKQNRCAVSGPNMQRCVKHYSSQDAFLQRNLFNNVKEQSVGFQCDAISNTMQYVQHNAICALYRMCKFTKLQEYRIE